MTDSSPETRETHQFLHAIPYNQAIPYLTHHLWEKSKLGLERTRDLLASLGNPERKLRFIHIAGTNGKGSTAAMLASILKEAGFRAGLTTSPYIHYFNERIQINGSSISGEDLERITQRVRIVAGSMADHPSVFELITAIAFLYFLEMRCDIVVLEVGMGGRLDSTNVIGTPEVAVITTIGLDHTRELGDTVEKIAAEKAGIIKPNGVVVCYPQVDSVKQVIREKCREENASLSFVDSGLIHPIAQTLDGQQFDYGEMEGLTIPLLGEHQLINAAVAMESIGALRTRGWTITERAVREGLRKTVWPGRFEVMRRSPVFVVDGAHNPQGVQAAVKSLGLLFPGRKASFLIGILRDKNYEEMVELLIPYATRFVTVTPNSRRALPADELAACIQRYAVEAIACESVQHGVERALLLSSSDDVICALGSLYMVGEIRGCLQALDGH